MEGHRVLEEDEFKRVFWEQQVTSNICISYNMGRRDLPDIYALASPRAAGPRAWAYISGKSRLSML